MLTKTMNPLKSKLSTKNLATIHFPDLPKLQNGLPAGMQRIIIGPNEMLTPHFHPDTNETTICLSGRGGVGIIVPDATKNNPIGSRFIESEFNTDDVVFLPQGYPHYFINRSSEHPLELLLTFENFNFNIITVADIMKDLPREVEDALEETVANAGHEPFLKY